MDDLTNKLSELLSTPEGMNQIKGLLSMFGNQGSSGNTSNAGSQQQTQEYQEDDDIPEYVEQSNRSQKNNSQLGFNLDTAALASRMNDVFSLMNTKDDSKVNLLMSLRPFLSSNRGSKLDQAVKMLQITKLSSLINKK